MSSVAAKSLGIIFAAVLATGWATTARAMKADDEAAVIVRLYKDFAWVWLTP